LQGVAKSNAGDDELFSAGEVWDHAGRRCSSTCTYCTGGRANPIDSARRRRTDIRTVPITPPIAATTVELPEAFPGDPADRMIYATAIERGWELVTKDRRLRDHRHPRPVTIG
jgi:PIN domain